MYLGRHRKPDHFTECDLGTPGPCDPVLRGGKGGSGYEKHFARPVAVSACMRGCRVRSSSASGQVAELLEFREDLTLERFHRQLERQQLRVLDGPEHAPFFWVGAEIFFATISRVSERQNLIFATNLPFESCTLVPGSE